MKSCPTCRNTYPASLAYCPKDGTALTETDQWQEGTIVLDKYMVLARVGQGNMGIVYKAEHLRFKELRALKVISQEHANDANSVKRFEREATIARRLQHPNAVRVDDIEKTEDGRFFIVMEFIKGQSLKGVIERDGPLPAARVCSIVKQVASALEAAHNLGMVHRDIKPGNIALVMPMQEQRSATLSNSSAAEIAKVLDFGIAKIREGLLEESGELSLTGIGHVIGTPTYMSPEQAMGKRGAELDGRSDLYSLGVVMYEMLTKDLPLKADSIPGMLIAHVHTPPTPIQSVRPDLFIPEPLASLVMRCLEKNRDLRPSSAQAFINEIERIEKPEPLPQTIRLLQPVSPHAPEVSQPLPSTIIVRPLEQPPPDSKGATKVNPKDGLKYVWIPPGSFQMGCSPGDTECENDEKPHQVTITKGFWLGQTAVTVGAYKRFAGATGRQMPPEPNFSGRLLNPGWGDDAMPIVDVTWDDAQAYCSWAGGRLPTEAEWEYAARAGSTAARYGDLDEIAWYADNSGRQRMDSAKILTEDQAHYLKRLNENGNGMHEVGQKRANGFGLYDMLGNVWEWVNDWYDPNYYQNSPSQDPTGPTSMQFRVLRGGSWDSGPGYVRVSGRVRLNPAVRNVGSGFRCGGEVFVP